MTRKHNRNRIWIVLLIMAVAIVMAIPAGAAVDCSNEKFADHPHCQDTPEPPPDDEPLAGTTCAAAIGELNEPVTQDFTVTLTEDEYTVTLTEDEEYTVTITDNEWASACIDVMADPGDWTVVVEEIGGTLRSLSLVVRDSVAPGDACDSVPYRGRDIPFLPFQITLDGFEDHGIAGSWVNSCGTDWAEWVGDAYYDDEATDVPSPLVLQVFMSGKDEKVKLTIDIP